MVALFAACGSGQNPPARDAGVLDGGSQPDAGLPRDGGAVPDAGLADGGGSGNTPCAFNRECANSERCECANGDCACHQGARGTGRSGVDACVDGNTCASSLCVEGRDGGYWCSGECSTGAECGAELPRCADIAFVGRICIR